MKRFIILNTPEFPVFGTHFFHAQKLGKGFEWNGLETLVVNSWHKLHEIGLCETDFIYLSSHLLNGTDDPTYSRPNPVANLYLEYIGSTGAIPILWFWHSYINTQMLEPLNNKFILTGEHFRRKPKTPSHATCWDIQTKVENYVPSTFAAAIHPDKIGTFERNEIKKASFVGRYYQPEWLNRLSNEKLGEVMITATPPFISEEDRISHFTNSVVCLGFHCPVIRDNFVLTERFFEGMAMGNVVISDAPYCEEVTEGAVNFVDSYDTMISLIDKAWNDVDYRKQKQKQCMNWCREHGTYLPVAKKFIEKASELYE